MKTFIYFSQGEWRTFQAESLPVKPDFNNLKDDHIYKDYKFYTGYNDDDILKQYESEIAALKAKSVKVGNPETIRDPRIMLKIFDHAVIDERDVFYEWPGTVEVKEELEYPIDHTSYPPYIEVAILKLPA